MNPNAKDFTPKSQQIQSSNPSFNIPIVNPRNNSPKHEYSPRKGNRQGQSSGQSQSFNPQQGYQGYQGRGGQRAASYHGEQRSSAGLESPSASEGGFVPIAESLSSSSGSSSLSFSNSRDEWSPSKQQGGNGRNRRSDYNSNQNLRGYASKSPSLSPEKGPIVDEKVAASLDEFSLDQFTSPGSHGKKGRSLNHLLNFSFPEREKPTYTPPVRRVRRQVYNKERYIHANFRFLVSDSENYQANLRDPDLVVDWDLVEQVMISTSQEQSCPICLMEPTAPRITKCGHVFCFTCILHYLALGEKSWRRCPICYDAVSAKDLRSAKIIKVVPYSEGDVIKMKLMKREKGSYVPWPRAEWNPSVEIQLPLTSNATGSIYSKLILATNQDVRSIVLADLEILKNQYREAVSAGDNESLAFVEQALAIAEEKLKQAEQAPYANLSEQLRHLDTKYKESSKEKKLRERSDSENSTGSSQLSVSPQKSSIKPPVTTIAQNQVFEKAFSDDDEDELERVFDLEKDSKLMFEPEAEKKLETKPEKHDFVYFYQAEDGQLIFAQSLMVRALLREYGSTYELPDTIQAKILELDDVSQTEDARRRHKQTAHLPLTAEMTFCELELKPSGGLISQEVYREFAGEFRQREQRRISKAKKEEQEKVKKEHQNLNNVNRYQRFEESYSSSFPVEDPFFAASSIPTLSPERQNLNGNNSNSSTGNGEPLAGHLLPSTKAPLATDPRNNYAKAVQKKSVEKSLFTQDDFAPLPSLSAYPALPTSTPKNQSKESSKPPAPVNPIPINNKISTANGETLSRTELATGKKFSFASAVSSPSNSSNSTNSTATNGNHQNSTKGKKKEKVVLLSTSSQRRYGS